MLLNMFAMGHGLHSRVRQEVWKFLYKGNWTHRRRQM